MLLLFYSFTGLSSKIIKEGFLIFQSFKRKEYVSEFPSLKENENYRIINFGIEKKMTEPPDYLTEAELIDEMEKYSIGTDGSIPSHIENLSLRGYVKVDEKRRIIPTKLGEVLIDSLDVIEPDIIRPENRAKIEQFVKQIETGEKTYDEALKSAIKFYKSKFIDCCSNVDNLRQEFGKYFRLKEMYKNRGRKFRNIRRYGNRGRFRGNRRFNRYRRY